jgi:hypothetical protein
MAILSPKEVTALADNFLVMAQAVGDYRMNATGLTSEEKSQFRELHWDLLNYSDSLYVTSANLVMEEVETSLKAIKEVTDDIRTSYKKLRNIQKAIDVAAGAVTLAAAIFSKNPQAIIGATANLVKVWKKIKKDSAEVKGEK